MFSLGGHRTKLCLSVAVLLLIEGYLGLDQDVDIVGDRCTRFIISAMLRDNSVFVDGGVQLFRDNETTWLGFSKYIFEIDMSRSWDTNTNFTERKIGRFGNSSMGANPPNMVRGGLFRGPANDKKLYTFGGSTFLANNSDPDWQPPSSDHYSLWSYDTSLMTWGQYDVTYAVPRRPNWGATAEAIRLGLGFILNGQVDRGSSYVLYTMSEYVGGKLSNATNNQTTYLGGMIIIDLLTQTARNVSTDTLGAPRVAGGLVHTQRFGKTENGTLVAFGGMRSRGERNTTFTNGILIDFTSISLCDTFNEDNVTWFNQLTSGEPPPPRIDFCVLPGPKSAKDNSSHNFYIYGGYDPTQSIMYDDVYILSLPSFTWTKAYSGTKPRFGHTCHTAGKRQMMSVGGSLDASMYAVETSGQLPNLSTVACDQKEGVVLFDLSALTWGSFFDAYAPQYQVPKSVVDVIGGSGDGGATVTQPVGGFVHAAISTMFYPSPTINSPTITPAIKHHHESNAGYIAGGVIGGVVGLAIVMGLAVYILRRKSGKDHYQCSPPQELTGESLPKELATKPPFQELPAEMRQAVELPAGA
ncbi:putative cell wall anchored protein [Halenospora varia]|nr:putative cell wall anchored protein [Halenospora varia]